MEEIMKQYGGFLLDIVVVSTIFILLFSNITDNQNNKGVIKILGAHIDTKVVDYNAYTEYSTLYTESTRSAPKMEYISDSQMHLGANKVTDILKVVNNESVELTFKVLSVTDEQGNDCTDLYDENTKVVTFNNVGIYTIQVSAIDSTNRKTVASINIPVCGN